ncbi:MAG: hypothetical protein HOQ24_17835, partial [Mycobacteriaceae bacterium]|nr:hypothetical protein [Mycobacteriaceae bacterium]
MTDTPDNGRESNGRAESVPDAVHNTEIDSAATLLTGLAEKVGGSASVRTVFGEPVVADGITVIPVARMSYGFGGGAGGGVSCGTSGTITLGRHGGMRS